MKAQPKCLQDLIKRIENRAWFYTDDVTQFKYLKVELEKITKEKLISSHVDALASLLLNAKCLLQNPLIECFKENYLKSKKGLPEDLILHCIELSKENHLSYLGVLYYADKLCTHPEPIEELEKGYRNRRFGK